MQIFGCSLYKCMVISPVIISKWHQLPIVSYMVLLIGCSVCFFIFLNQSQTDDGEDDLKKGTQLLEIYALEIQMYTAQKNNKKLKALYEQSLHIKSAIPHPLIMGVIRGTTAFKSLHS